MDELRASSVNWTGKDLATKRSVYRGLILATVSGGAKEPLHGTGYIRRHGAAAVSMTSCAINPCQRMW